MIPLKQIKEAALLRHETRVAGTDWNELRVRTEESLVGTAPDTRFYEGEVSFRLAVKGRYTSDARDEFMEQMARQLHHYFYGEVTARLARLMNTVRFGSRHDVESEILQLMDSIDGKD